MVKGRVIRILDDRNLVLNVGEQQKVTHGMRFGIYTPADEIVDPETKAILGRYRTRKALVEARVVYPRFSIVSAPLRAGTTFDRALRAMRSYEPLPVATEDIQPLPTGAEIRIG